jgi:hypothetical protein
MGTAFTLAAIYKFRLWHFQIALPLLFVIYILASAEVDAVSLTDRSLRSAKDAWEHQAEIFQKSFFEGSLWGLFHLMTYLYLYTKANADSLKRNAFANKLPMSGVVLTVSSFLYQFPELEPFRKIFPLSTAVEHSLMFADLSLIPLYLLTSRWMFNAMRELSTVIVYSIVFVAGGVSLSLYNPLGIERDQDSRRVAERMMMKLSSWDVEQVNKYGASDEIRQDYLNFGKRLGVAKSKGISGGQVYSFLTPSGRYKMALYAATVEYESGKGNYYLVLIKIAETDWILQRMEVSVGSTKLNFYRTSEHSEATPQ